jgi:hypothetical protein
MMPCVMFFLVFSPLFHVSPQPLVEAVPGAMTFAGKKMPAWDHSQAGQEKGALRHEQSRLAADSGGITPGGGLYSGAVKLFLRGAPGMLETTS